MTNDEANTALLNLWGETFSPDADVRMPAAYPRLQEGALLFVGCNPSFSIRGWNRILKLWEGEPISPEEFFAWRNRAKYDLAKAIELEKHVRKHHTYYKPQHRLAKQYNLPMEHLDIFAYRKTNQSALEPLVGKVGELTTFGERQFEVFDSLLAAARPRAVLVANALASRIYYHRHLSGQSLDPGTGFYWDSIAGAKVPVLLSGMLSGKRAIDTYSRERLYWQLGRVINTREA